MNGDTPLGRLDAGLESFMSLAIVRCRIGALVIRTSNGELGKCAAAPLVV